LRFREEVFWWLRAARRDLERAERSLLGPAGGGESPQSLAHRF